eukprot:UN03236
MLILKPGLYINQNHSNCVMMVLLFFHTCSISAHIVQNFHNDTFLLLFFRTHMINFSFWKIDMINFSFWDIGVRQFIIVDDRKSR